MTRLQLADIAQERREVCRGDKEQYPIVGLEHLTPSDINLGSYDQGKDNTFTKMFYKGDILFGRRRAYLKKAAMAPFDGICSGDITVISAIPDKILPELLPFIIQNDHFFDFAVGKSAGSLSPRVKWEHLKKYKFNLPSLPEQKKLAQVLWAAENTRQAYKKLLTQTDQLIKAKFIEILESCKYKLVNLGEVCEFRPKQNLTGFSDDTLVSFVPMATLNQNEVDFSATEEKPIKELKSGYTYFEDNDVLLAKITPCFENGKAGIAKGLKNGIGFGSTEFIVIRADAEKVKPEWIYYFINSDDFLKVGADNMTGTAGQRRVPSDFVANYKIPFPSIEEQKKIGEEIEQMQATKKDLQNSLDNLNAMTKKLTNNTFNQGGTDV